MPSTIVANSLLLPELDLLKASYDRSVMFCFVKKRTSFEVCPRCAVPSHSIYDHRTIRVKDAPVRAKLAYLVVKKRRFYCKPCRLPFTEPINGVKKGHRTTQRYRRDLLWGCENFTDLKRVRRHYRCSYGLLYNSVYEQLELLRRKNLQYAWPKVVGIDEHTYRRYRRSGKTDFATLVADYSNRRIYELVHGKTIAELNQSLAHIPGRENVTKVLLDLSDPYKSFVREFFPNAQIIADKFHVLRLLTPTLNRRRKAISGDRRTNPIGKLLLKNGNQLGHFKRRLIYQWLEPHTELKEVYEYKEALHRLYRIKGFHRASKAFTRLTDQMAHSRIKEIKTLRRTLMRWRNEILAYFKFRLTNARTEAYNNLAKLVQRRSFGYRSFRNYRLRLLNAYSGAGYRR